MDSKEMQSKEEHPRKNYKKQLDRKADEAHKPSQRNENTATNTTNPIIKKVTEYVPAAKSILGDPQGSEEKSDDRSPPPGPPERPIDDDKIEDFVREQHTTKVDKALN